MLPYAVPVFALKKSAIVQIVTGLSLVMALAIDPTILAAAVVTIITALTGSAILIINALGKMKLELLAAATAHQHKLETIEHHTNGLASASATKRTVDEETIAELRTQLVKAERREELLAQSTAVVGVVAPVAAKAP